MSDEFNAKEYRHYREERDDSDPYFPKGTVHEDVFIVLGERLFVWDKPKNDVNKRIHGIDFYTAVYVFNDEDRLEDDNQVVDGEHREQAIGEPMAPIAEGHPIDTKHSRPKAIIGEVEGVLFVVFAVDEGPDWTATRIISARAADKDEVKAYFDEKYASQ
jgi:uncharacterized DUF497 family protein